jgi:hypothetical protein
MDLDQQADELYESWINGNLSSVVEVITRVSSKPDAVTSVALAVKLGALMNERERTVLVGILKNKL